MTRATSLGNCGTGHTRAAASSHPWLYLPQITAWHWGQKWALGGGRVKGWWQWRRRGGPAGRRGKGAKSHLKLYAFPSLSSIQINWIYVAIVRLKPRTPVMLPRRKSVTFKAKTSTSCLPKQNSGHSFRNCTLSTLMTSTALTHEKRFLESQQIKWLHFKKRERRIMKVNVYVVGK